MVLTTPLLQTPRHDPRHLLIQGDMQTAHAVNFAPTFTAGGFERELDVGEGLVDFGVEVGGDRDGVCLGGVPAACRVDVLVVGNSEGGFGICLPRALTGYLNCVADTDCLAVVEVFFGPFADVWVGGELGLGHAC